MKKLQGVLKISVFFLLCAGVGMKIKKFYAVERPKKFSLHIDRHFSKKMAQRLNAFAKEQEKMSISVQLFSMQAQETFPAISSLVLKSHASGQVQVVVKGARPVALVNDAYVLGSNNRLIERDLFVPQETKELPAFYVSQSKKDKEALKLSGRCKAFIRQFDRSLLNLYDVQWVNGALVLLRDVKHKRITMLVNDKTAVTPALQTAYTKVKNEILKKQTKAKGRDWFVDMRFRNQVIVFPKGEKV